MIVAAEKKLGFGFPPLLREIHGKLANGGFGPGAGLIGLEDGYTDAEFYDLTLVEYHVQLCESYPESPKYLIDICNLGCGDTYAVDCSQSDYPVIMTTGQGENRVSTFNELMERWADGEE